MKQTSELDELAKNFVIPQRSGVYLAKSEIIVLANLSDGSLRVNERSRMLADVLKSPSSPRDLSALVGRLGAFCAMHVDWMEAVVSTWPALAGPLENARARAIHTQQTLADLQEEILWEESE